MGPAPADAPAAGRPTGRGPRDPEEAAWIERARAGDREAFGRLVERHRDRVHGLARRVVRDPADAEEVAQDAFVRAWRALSGFRGDAAFSTWLYRIALRCAYDRAEVMRHRRARETAVEHLPERAAPDRPPLEPAARAMHARLEALLARLPERQRVVVTLYYYEDRSVEDVARILGMPENTVKTHLSRARAALRDGWLSEGTD